MRRMWPSGSLFSSNSSFLSTFTLVLIAPFLCSFAHAQSFQVIHTFTGGADGAESFAGLTIDRAGNLYGTTSEGGYFDSEECSSHGCGTVFKLAQRNSVWMLSPLHMFTAGSDGENPLARVIFGPDGNLYGTTHSGGGPAPYGTVFRLRPSPNICGSALCLWSETILHRFSDIFGGPDGASPMYGDLIFDSAGNIYGTTFQGGLTGCGEMDTCGVAFELSPSGNSWMEQAFYDFGEFGGHPYSGMLMDPAGNLYGTVQQAVYKLSYSQGAWSGTALAELDGQTVGGLLLDASGNLYGTTLTGGGGGGTVFELSPSGQNWIFQVLYTFPGLSGPTGILTMDRNGNLYGSTSYDGAYDRGNVFKLSFSNRAWTYTSLYDFTGGADGSAPFGQVIVDTNGNLYGVTAYGGDLDACENDGGCGVVWKITP
jgi:uncharacterized repeat protein (TIGR03803 family)